MKKSKFRQLVSMVMLLSVISLATCTKDEADILLQEIAVNVSALQLGVGEIQPIVATASPENTTQYVSWVSSNDDIAVIQFNESGLVAGVKGIALGDATLTATNPDGTISKTVPVSVITKVQKIELEEEALPSPSETKYKVVFTPSDATIQTVTWSTSDPGVAAVVDGVVTAVAPGVTTITATSDQGGKAASVEVAVSGNPPILGFQYCSVSGTGSYNADVVQTTGGGENINNTELQPSGNYHYYEGEKLTVAPGGSFDLSVTQSNNWSMTVVWIDWNGDKDFADDGEQVQVFGTAGQLNDGPFNATIDVPEDAVPGLLRMRVLTGDAWTTDPSVAPCGEIANNTTKDFDVEVVGKLYCSVSGTGSYNADAVTTSGGNTNINYAGDQPSGNYEYYTDETLTVAMGGNFNLSVTQSNNWSMTIVWIDWNADGDFGDEGELAQIFGTAGQLNDGPFNAQIDIPVSAAEGKTRMRILTGDAWTTNSSAEPCGEIANSTTKDFVLEIIQ